MVVPLYLQVATDIAAKIGRDPAFSERLPSEADLVEGYAASRITIRLALDHLTKRGLIVRQQGRGTFVSRPQRRTLETPSWGVMDQLSAQGIDAKSELLSFGPAHAPPGVVDALDLTSVDVIFLQRRYCVMDRPAVLTEVYYPPAIAGLFDMKDAEKQSSLHLLVEKAGLQLGQTKIAMQVVPAPEHVSKVLAIDPDTALMMLRRLTYTQSGQPCEHSTLYARAGVGEFTITSEDSALHRAEWLMPSVPLT